MQLVEDGLVDLDEKISTYFPDAKTDSKITVRNLLTHTSRYSLLQGRELFGIENPSPLALETRTSYLLETAPETDDIGKKFEYSNSNFQLLGAIIQNVSGKSYETYIEQKVFAPLNMDRSFTAFPDAQKHGMATGYRYIYGEPVPNNILNYNGTITPSGYLVSTANDMANYMIALLNRGSFDSTAIISEESVEEMFTAYNDHINYGFGWGVYKEIAQKLFSMTGLPRIFRPKSGSSHRKTGVL